MARWTRGLGVVAAAGVAWGAVHAQGPQSEPKLRLVIRSDLSNAFALQEVVYNWDDQPPVTRQFPVDNPVNSGVETELQDSTMAPGPHTVNLALTYAGTGYGVFSYLKGYSFTLKGVQQFTAAAGKETTLKGLAYEKGDLTTELKDKPALRMETVDRELPTPGLVKREEPVAAGPQKDVQLKTAEEAAEGRLEILAARVTDLGHRIEKSREKLGALQDSAISGSTSAGKANVLFRNEMGSSFKLRELHIYLDGAAIRDEVDTGDTLASKEEVALFDGRIVPGSHTLNVNAVYQGVGYGVFSYLNDFQFKMRSTHAFTVEQGKLTAVKVVAYESGDARTEIKDRPTLRFDKAVTPIPAAAAPAVKPAAAAR